MLYAQVSITSGKMNYFIKEKKLEAEGDVKVTYTHNKGIIKISCQNLIFYQVNKKIKAFGNITIIDQDGNILNADKIDTDLALKNSLINHFEVLLEKGGKFTCLRGVRKDENFIFDESHFTTCETNEGEKPFWGIAAKKVVYDQKKDLVQYYKGYIQIKGNNFLPIPYFSHPGSRSERTWGVLPPILNPFSRELGVVVGVPIYYPFNNYRDFTFTSYYASNFGIGFKNEYRQNFYNGYFNTEGSYLYKTKKGGEKFKNHNWHIFLDLYKKISEKHLFHSKLKRASSPYYLKNFWFIRNTGFLNYEPLVSEISYSFLLNRGYFNFRNLWVQNRFFDKDFLHTKDIENKLIFPSFKYDAYFQNVWSGTVKLYSNFIFVDSDASYWLNNFSWSKEWITQGNVFGLKIHEKFLLSEQRKQKQSPSSKNFEHLPHGTLSWGYPLLHKNKFWIFEPTLILNIAKPFSSNYEEILLRTSRDFESFNILDSTYNTFPDYNYRVIFGANNKFYCTHNLSVKSFLGCIINNKRFDETKNPKFFSTLDFNYKNNMSCYIKSLLERGRIVLVESGIGYNKGKQGINIGIVHLNRNFLSPSMRNQEQSHITQLNFDFATKMSKNYTLRFGYIGNLNTKKDQDHHKFAKYIALNFENECITWELGFAMDTLPKMLGRDKLDYKILLQIIPKFSRTQKVPLKQYLPLSPISH